VASASGAGAKIPASITRAPAESALFRHSIAILLLKPFTNKALHLMDRRHFNKICWRIHRQPFGAGERWVLETRSIGNLNLKWIRYFNTAIFSGLS
jgi:hypothetical protein